MLQRLTLILLLSLVLLPHDVYAGTVQLPATGLSTTIAAGDDASVKAGAAWPKSRFKDNKNGTVTDNLTGLVWLQNAGCIADKTWAEALTAASRMASAPAPSTSCLKGHNTWAVPTNAIKYGHASAPPANCCLSDGSTAGQWRLPNLKELESLFDRSGHWPALPQDHPFFEIRDENCDYWSSSSYANDTSSAWIVDMTSGTTGFARKKNIQCVWLVRSAKPGSVAH